MRFAGANEYIAPAERDRLRGAGPVHRDIVQEFLMSESAATIRVECYAGYRGEEAPKCFFLGERGIGVEEVLDRWLDPEYRYFKVRGDDGGVYILRHDMSTAVWEMILYDSGTREETRLSST
jgi:hypothetical protein